MDKYEYKIRSEEIKSLIAEGAYAEAAEIADTIDWRRVKSVMMLCTVSDLYKVNRRYEDAKNLLLLAYDKKPGGRTICYSLCELCIKTEEFVEAVKYYNEFMRVAPKDPERYILQYKLYEAQNVNLEERIGVLEELKKRDYREKWAYELAYLYHRVGLATRCVEECDELILWFGEGKYVVKAMELKMLHQPLSFSQQEAYDHRFDAYAAEETEQYGEDGEPEYYEQQDVYGDPVGEAVPYEGYENGGQEPGWEVQEDAPLPEEMDIQVKTMDVGQYNTINLQEELAAGLQEVLGAEDVGYGRESYGEYGENVPDDGEMEGTEVFFGETGEIEEAQLDQVGNRYEEAGGTVESDVLPEQTMAPSGRVVRFPGGAERAGRGADSGEYWDSAAEETAFETEEAVAAEQTGFGTAAKGKDTVSGVAGDAGGQNSGYDTQDADVPDAGYGRMDTEELDESYVRTDADTQKAGYVRPDDIAQEGEESRPDVVVQGIGYGRPNASAQYTKYDGTDAVVQSDRYDSKDSRVQNAGRGEAEAAVREQAQQESGSSAEATSSVVIHQMRAEVTGAPAQPPKEMAEVLQQETDGQIRMVLPEKTAVERQLTGQMKIDDILAEWERMKKENEEKCREEVRQHVLRETGPMFTEFEAAVRDGLLEQLEGTSPERQEDRQRSRIAGTVGGALVEAAGMAAGAEAARRLAGSTSGAVAAGNGEVPEYLEGTGNQERQVSGNRAADWEKGNQAVPADAAAPEYWEEGEAPGTAGERPEQEYWEGDNAQGAMEDQEYWEGDEAPVAMEDQEYWEGDEAPVAMEGQEYWEGDDVPGVMEDQEYWEGDEAPVAMEGQEYWEGDDAQGAVEGQEYWEGDDAQGAMDDQEYWEEDTARNSIEEMEAREYWETEKPRTGLEYPEGNTIENATGEPEYIEGENAGENADRMEQADGKSPANTEDDDWQQGGVDYMEAPELEEAEYSVEAEDREGLEWSDFRNEREDTGETADQLEREAGKDEDIEDEDAEDQDGIAFAEAPEYEETADDRDFSADGDEEEPSEALDYLDALEHVEEAELLENQEKKARRVALDPDGFEMIGPEEEDETAEETTAEQGKGKQTASSKEDTSRGKDTSGKSDQPSKPSKTAEGSNHKSALERDKAKVRSMTREEKELFAPFIQSRQSREQLVKALDNISMAAYTGNVVITGEEGMDTLTLAKNMIREVRMTDSNFSGKVAKITGQGFNRKNVKETLEGLNNGALIIQKAAGMDSKTAGMLHVALQQEKFGIIVILEDTKKAIQKLFLGTPQLFGDFTARVDLEALSNDTLVSFGKRYAREKEYSIDDLGMLALHTRIEESQTIDHVVTVIEVKQIVDEAIRHANRKTLGHFFDILLARRYDDEDMIILTEKDFVA